VRGRGGRGKSAGKGKRLSKVMSMESSKNSQGSSAGSAAAAGKKRKSSSAVSGDGNTPDTTKSSSEEPMVKTESSEKSSNKRESESISSSTTAKNEEESSQPPSKMAKIDSVSSSAVESKDKNCEEATTKVKDDPEKSASDREKKISLQEKGPQQGSEEQAASLVPSMSTPSVEQHLDSLHSGLHLTPRRIASKCITVVKKLMSDQYGWIFKDPVDPIELGLPDYFEVVQNPMDLGLVEKNLENGEYKDLDGVESDIRLVFENAILYNGENSDVGEMAKSLLNLFVREWKSVLKGEDDA